MLWQLSSLSWFGSEWRKKKNNDVVASKKKLYRAGYQQNSADNFLTEILFDFQNGFQVSLYTVFGEINF